MRFQPRRRVVLAFRDVPWTLLHGHGHGLGDGGRWERTTKGGESSSAKVDRRCCALRANAQAQKGNPPYSAHTCLVFAATPRARSQVTGHCAGRRVICSARIGLARGDQRDDPCHVDPRRHSPPGALTFLGPSLCIQIEPLWHQPSPSAPDSPLALPTSASSSQLGHSTASAAPPPRHPAHAPQQRLSTTMESETAAPMSNTTNLNPKEVKQCVSRSHPTSRAPRAHPSGGVAGSKRRSARRARRTQRH